MGRWGCCGVCVLVACGRGGRGRGWWLRRFEENCWGGERGRGGAVVDAWSGLDRLGGMAKVCSLAQEWRTHHVVVGALDFCSEIVGASSRLNYGFTRKTKPL